MCGAGQAISLVGVGLVAKTLVVPLLGASEFLNGDRIDVFLVVLLDFVSSVVGVLCFHSDVGSLVDCHASRCFFARANSHIQVEGLVDLILAILDAGLLSRGLSGKVVRIDTIEVAATEKKSWQGGLHEGLALVHRVVCPRCT